MARLGESDTTLSIRVLMSIAIMPVVIMYNLLMSGHDGVEFFYYAHADSADPGLSNFEYLPGVVSDYCLYFAQYDDHCVVHGHYRLQLTG